MVALHPWKPKSRMAPTGIGYAASTLFGVLYSERDKSGLKRSVWEVLRFGSFVPLIWAAIVFALLPLLMKVYGMPANHDVKVIVLLLLAFWKNLGKKKSFILFSILISMDVASLILVLINMINTSFNFSLMGVITAIVADGTVGLGLRGKYIDKAERGSI